MTPQEKYEELKKTSKSPDGLKNVINILFTDSSITWRTVKDINEMADKVIFFYENEAVFELTLPWNVSNLTTQQELTEKYKFLLNQN